MTIACEATIDELQDAFHEWLDQMGYMAGGKVIERDKAEIWSTNDIKRACAYGIGVMCGKHNLPVKRGFIYATSLDCVNQLKEKNNDTETT